MKLVVFSIFLKITFIFTAQITPTFDDILIPMRDGKFLQADVYVPTNVDSAEVILIQTPYNKNLFSWSLPMGVGTNLNSQPFIWVIVDWRGFYGSNAAIVSNPNRGEDGYDVCEWITNQIWHKDRIGTWGPSALGGIQYLTAQQQHPNHTCAVPIVAHPHTSYDSYFYGGVLEKARLEQLDALGYGLSPVILNNIYYSPTWQFTENSSWNPSGITIPTLQIGGWYDHNIDKMMDWYTATRNSAAAPVQNKQWLLVGPWVHGGSGIAYVGSSVQGELSYPNAEFKSDTMAWEFLEYHLLDANNNWDATALITFYETGINNWNTTNANTIEEVNYDLLYLNNGNTLSSSQGINSTSFTSDPRNPSPTLGGATLHSTLDQGPYDQISLEGRSDIVSFESGILPQSVSISGRTLIDLFVEADQPDCDIAVRLVDVYPDGRNMLITDGIRRMRFRNGYSQTDEVFMTPGTIYPVQVELPFTNYTWITGHKIKVLLGGNNAYRWDVNLQNGGQMYAAGDTNVANISIYHNTTYPSKISLPGSNAFLSIDELSNSSFNVSPNPTNDIITISSENNIEEITLFDLTGKLIMNQKSTTQIDLTSLDSGIYIVKVRINGRVFEQRVCKN